ncbi:MAG: RpiB/LacA/LacB family sugar-phosphate isomerase [Lachnospiraceae bacterium]|nr:RpiB/LacA/LacB family sugar-phosphate isomerase [Lachnospiraceae bacterium]
MKIAIGSDHCGYELKMKLLPYLEEKHEVIDHGCYSTDSVDFPDIAVKVCDDILSGRAERGIMFCSTGIGAAIACNKIAGIRAGVCHDIYSAHQCVEHDNVQVLAIGGDIVGYYVAKQLVDAFLGAEFLPDEEFRRRVRKLELMEAK